MKLIYMDHHATTPIIPEVLEAMMPFLQDHFGNPSSTTHGYGHIARKAVEDARAQVADLVGATPQEIVFTSGATEADNLALKGIAYKQAAKKGHFITISTEHKAILDTTKRLEKEGYDVTLMGVDEYGRIDLDRLRQTIREDTILISIQAANSEIGTTQPLSEIGDIAHEHGILFHSDAVQALGRLEVNVDRDNVDMLSISAHKMYGPKGIGALYVKKGIKLVPLIDGGGHEMGMRSGTLNVPAIVGMGKASEIAKRDMKSETDRVIKLRERLRKGIEDRIEQVKLNGHPDQRLPNNLNYSFAYVEGESLMLALKDFALSSGSACTSASLQSSYVLKAIGVPDSLAHCSIRFGLGRSNTETHVDYLVDCLETEVKRLREMSPLYEMAQNNIDIESFSWRGHKH
jgi:cysteine desulfurase